MNEELNAPASMRPPRKTGENFAGGEERRSGLLRFNEAPAKDGGKRWIRFGFRHFWRCFNEAPAKDGGKPTGIRQPGHWKPWLQ